MRRPRLLASDHDPEVRRHLPLLIGGRFSSNLLLRFPAPFLGVIAAGLGTSVGVMGVALSAGEFAGLAAPAVGRAADRRGARTAMGVGLSLVTTGALLAAGAPGVVVFALAMVVVQLSKPASTRRPPRGSPTGCRSAGGRRSPGWSRPPGRWPCSSASPCSAWSSTGSGGGGATW